MVTVVAVAADSTAVAFMPLPALSMAGIFTPRVPLLPAASGMVRCSVTAAFITSRFLRDVVTMRRYGSIATSGQGFMAMPALTITATRRAIITDRAVSAA